MKLFSKGKDGGPESSVTGYWLIELKCLFSIVLLKFEGKSRDAYHEHAFNCISWVLWGQLDEHLLGPPKGDGKGRVFAMIYGGKHRRHTPSFWPLVTYRTDHHKVDSKGTTWVLSFRGPWNKTWTETLPNGERRTLASGRKVVSASSGS